MTERISRLAPSPTGALHLGNARSFLINWAIARQRGWKLVMRMEDLDGPRIKADAARDALNILCWLGLDWDGDVSYQTHDLSPYRKAMRQLAAMQRTYACSLPRSEIEAAASAPHVDDHELRYPSQLRPDVKNEPQRFVFDDEATNYRLIVENREVVVADEIYGERIFQPAQEIGDFVVWTKREIPAYQLAVVVDDDRQGVTDVVRGDDLLPSAARQVLIYEALGWTPPRFWHLPLVIGEDGRRLAKRHGDTRLTTYMKNGVCAQRVVGLLAYWSGVSDVRAEMTAAEFCNAFEVDEMPKTPIVFTKEDDAWLTANA